MSEKQPLCPGKEQMVEGARDLSPPVFRRLVARRARQIVDRAVDPVSDEETRGALEEEIEEHFEKIHRGADFLPARFLPDGASRARAVCRIVTQTSYGTGFVIAPGFLMTNNHVLGLPSEAQESVAEFGFGEGSLGKRVVTIEPEKLFITDPGLDFTIVGCDIQNMGDLEPIALLRNPATVTRNERVNIIQHPRGRPKEVALHDNRVTRVKDKVVHYRTDTEPGSSGSPVFNNEWNLVALHHAGWAEDGGAATNEGIRMSAIVSYLLSRAREPSRDDEALRSILANVTDVSPYLGFFDYYGVGEPGTIEVEVPDFTGTPDFADVGVWNIEHLNDQVSDQRIEDVADVLARLAMDVLGLVEIQRGALNRLVNALGRRGFSMGYVLSDVPGSQDLAVLYDQETTAVNPRNDIASRHEQRLNAKTSSGKTAFPRHPSFAECTVQDENGQEVKFLMILVHLKAFGDAQSQARRRLAAKMLAEIIEDIREREGLAVVLGGDFNERLDNDVLAALKGSPDLFAMTADDATTDSISYVGGSYRSLIDHILVSRDVRLGEISGDDAAIVRLDQSVRVLSELRARG